MAHPNLGSNATGSGGSARDRGSQQNTAKGSRPSRQETAATNAAHPTTPSKPAPKVQTQPDTIRDKLPS